MINCPYCGKLTDPKLDNCPHCGGYMRRGPAPAAGGGGQRQTCPSCHALVQDGDIICVNCGTNLLTGQKISEEKKVMARKRRSIPLWVWLAIVAAVALLAVLALFLAGREGNPVARADRLVSEDRLSEATAELDNYLKTRPSDAAAQFKLGQLYWRLGQYGPAAQAFRQAAKYDRGNRDAFLLAAAALASSGDPASRQQLVEVLQDMVSAYPNDQDAYFLLGMARGAVGDRAGQVQALQKAVALDPAEAEGHEYLGLALAFQGLYPEANAELDRALAEKPQDSDLKAAKAFVGGVLNDGNSAALLREAIEQRTSIQGIALTQLGLSLVSQGQFEPAVGYLNEAKALGSQSDTAKLFHGIALAATGRLDEALSAFSELSQGKGPRAAEAEALAAQVYLGKGDPARAREAIDRAAALGAQGAPFYTAKGRVHVAAGEDAEAREAFKSAIQSNPDYPPAYLEYGLFHITREQAFDEGIRKLERYLELLNPAERQSYGRPIQDLVAQLKQTGGQEPAAPAQPGAPSGVVS